MSDHTVTHETSRPERSAFFVYASSYTQSITALAKSSACMKSKFVARDTMLSTYRTRSARHVQSVASVKADETRKGKRSLRYRTRALARPVRRRVWFYPQESDHTDMLNRFTRLALASICCVYGGLMSANAMAASDIPVSTANSWRFIEDPDYTYAKGSASQLLSLKEVVLHHALMIKINKNTIDSYTFKVGCMLQNPTPLFELKVNSLDIRLFDSVNDFVFARFIVDNNQEYSLRGELTGRNRIVFGPITKNQERSLSDLFLQMREGGELKIAMLQGNTNKPRMYNIPLPGFMEYSDKIVKSCTDYNSMFGGNRTYLPDYMAKEPVGYATKDFSLKKKEEDVIDPNAPRPVVAEKPKEEPKSEPIPEVMPFAPGGGPVSIGEDGRPVGADGSAVAGASGAQADRSLGAAQGPMQIGPDGRPVAPQAQNAQEQNGQGQNGQAPAQDGQQPPLLEETPADGAALDIF